MPQLTGIRLCVGGKCGFSEYGLSSSALEISELSPLYEICRAFITRGSENYRNRDAAQGDLGRRGQEVLLPRMLFLSRESKEVKN